MENSQENTTFILADVTEGVGFPEGESRRP